MMNLNEVWVHVCWGGLWNCRKIIFHWFYKIYMSFWEFNVYRRYQISKCGLETSYENLGDNLGDDFKGKPKANVVFSRCIWYLPMAREVPPCSLNQFHSRWATLIRCLVSKPFYRHTIIHGEERAHVFDGMWFCSLFDPSFCFFTFCIYFLICND